MPFTEKTLMDDRLCFIAACLRSDEPMTTLCRRYGISRKTGYKWLGRYREDGAAGLEDRSRAPQATPHGISLEIATQVVELKRRHPTWGPRKLLARLEADCPETSWPAASTIGDLLGRHGLVRPMQTPRRTPRSPGPTVEATQANDSWSADFKGWFRTGDGTRCEPLTISDNYSRYLITCHAVPRLTVELVRPHFEQAFREHGLPRAIRTDNGAPFAHRVGLGGLTRLSVWLLTLDVWPDRIAPGRPDQNGRHERMHRTLAQDTASPPAPTLALQQALFDSWRQEYNNIRPHEALGQKPPATLHQSSPRQYRDCPSPWTYPEDHHVKRVYADGYFKWRGERVYLTEALATQRVGIAQQDNGDWLIRFRGFDLAELPENAFKIRASRLARSGKP